MRNKRTIKLAFKLAASTAAFLCLTVLVAFGLRSLTEEGRARGPASLEADSVFEHRGNLSASELGMLGSTPLLRGRRVVFHPEALRRPVNGAVILNLFPDAVLTAHLQAPSAYTVNEGLIAGTIEGDSSSTVRILLQGGSVDGTIIFRGREYRVIDGGSSGQAIITESEAP